MSYRKLPPEAKAKGEFQYLAKSLAPAPNGIHQGIYVVTPSGKFIKQCNTGWPKLNTKECYRLLKAAHQEYHDLAKSERLAKNAMSLSDRSMLRRDIVKPPKTWTQIRTTTRSYAFADMEYFDLRHPAYYKLDRLWLTPATARTLVPDLLKVGETSDIKGRALHHFIMDNHLMLGCPPWPDNAVKKARLRVKIIRRKGYFYDLRYEGALHLDANSRWNTSAYSGKLLGKAVWNNQQQKFVSLHWVSLGEQNKRELRSNETRGNVHKTHVGSFFELDPLLPNDVGITPHSWEDRYPQEMKSKATR